MAEGTAALRAAAAHWSLAGDQRLLDILQDIHQRIMSRCSETSSRLELMARGLRDASVSLQNVNNRFLALSNTQFVESRVYEDDADLAPPPAAAREAARPAGPAASPGRLRRGLAALQARHDTLTILGDSASDTDSDADDRLVLKPKDLYADRPLPYIIGSQAWKSKWHAGLIQDDSDSDSSTSRVEELEQYSESDDGQPAPPGAPPARAHPPGEQSAGSSSPEPEPGPARAAAELARRLGAGAKPPDKEPPHAAPDTPVRKPYKPHQTPSAQIFSDEPPPLDEYSSDEDIFAELHRPHRDRRSRPPEQPAGLSGALFGRPPDSSDESEYTTQSPVYEDDVPEVRPPEPSAGQRDDSVKKPVGGISLFGSNKHAESIGAAILNRNRRKSSTSGDESNTEEREANEAKATNEVKRERDIFDDLFAKSEKLNKKSAKIEEKPRIEEAKPIEVKADAFGDIFDDIDDIFSTDIVNVQIKETKKDQKPLFDDDDDLFAEIPKVTNLGKDKVKIDEKTSLFDGNKLKSEIVAVKDSKVNVIKEIKKESKSIFDSDSDDGLFTNAAKDFKGKADKSEKPVEYKISDDIFGDDDDVDDLFGNAKPLLNETVRKSNTLFSKATEISKAALFDSDDELFANDSKKTKILREDKSNKNDTEEVNDDNLFASEVKRPEKELRASKSINDSSDLFKKEEKSKALKVIESINNDIFNDGDDLFKKTETIKESKIETVHHDFGNKELFPTDERFSKNNSDKIQDTGSTPTVESADDFKTTPPENIFSKSDAQIGNILRTTRIAADEEIIQTDKPKPDMLNDSNEDLFRTVPPIPLPKDQEVEKNDYFYQDIPELESPRTIETKNDKNDIFSDIFDDVPPVFEKPKEPKKSQNVNALYGDDSDDEALFFKKNDVINDEKPDFSPSGEIFGIFNDEPPALDIDFVQKTTKNDSTPQTDVKTETFNPKVDRSDDSVSKLDEKDSINVPIEPQDTTDNTNKEPKKIGKLKAMNFNINVNTLLPGASPKKKQLEDTDGQTASNEELHKTDKIEPKMVKSISFDDPEILDNKISKERAKIQVKRRPSTRRARKEAVRKSAIDLTDSSLDSSNDNSVKDDVKVVKTVYILNDDDIFGDSSKKGDLAESTKKHLNIVDSDEELFKNSEGKDVTDSKANENKSTDVLNLLKGNDEKKSSLDSDDDDLFKTNDKKSKKPKQGNSNEFKENQNERKSFFDSDDSDDLFKTSTKTKTATVISKTSKADENLFKNDKKNETKKENSKSFLDSDENDDLFTNSTSKLTTKSLKSNLSSDEESLFTNINTTNQKGIETLGKAYKTDTQVTRTATNTQTEVHNVFDDFPPKPIVVEEKINIKPQEIKQVKKVEKVVQKSILDVSSDEDDLFKARTKLTAKKDDRSLFGDDKDDGDDLFGAKTVREPKQASIKNVPQSTKEAKPTETVFVDPLSLFGDEE